MCTDAITHECHCMVQIINLPEAARLLPYTFSRGNLARVANKLSHDAGVDCSDASCSSGLVSAGLRLYTSAGLAWTGQCWTRRFATDVGKHTWHGTLWSIDEMPCFEPGVW